MALGIAQFLMVLDTSVMNVSITQLVEDFDTEVTAIQAVITLYTLVMAAFMITGGKVGDLLGRRRAFTIGLVVYAIGSGLTAVAPTLLVLALGWSIIEGLGATLVLPALAALVGGNYQGRDRAVAYGVIGGLAGAGIAVGPLLGGWVTTYLTWRLVFAGEVVVVAAILLMVRWVDDTERPARRPQLDLVGATLSALGLGLVVLGVLQSGTWGWLQPRSSPWTPFGLSLTPFVIGAGVVLLVLFRDWQQRREREGKDPLVRLELFRIPALRSGLSMLLAQNLILLGLFFTVPLYLQVVQGLDAFETGLRLLPVSVTMFVTALLGPALGRYAGPRRVVQTGILVLVAATGWLLTTIDPEIDDLSFGIAMALLGVGMGLLASQLGNVVQSSVGAEARSEVGGLQYTAQNLGSSLGTALIGAVLVGALATAATRFVEEDERVSAAVQEEVGVALQAGISFLSTDQVRTALEAAEIPDAEVDALVEDYASAQLIGLKIALLAAAAIALASFRSTRDLPKRPLTGEEPIDESVLEAGIPPSRAAAESVEVVTVGEDPPQDP
jgi:EmrB/QacA subfamily drug resistance transporter